MISVKGLKPVWCDDTCEHQDDTHKRVTQVFEERYDKELRVWKRTAVTQDDGDAMSWQGVCGNKIVIVVQACDGDYIYEKEPAP